MKGNSHSVNVSIAPVCTRFTLYFVVYSVRMARILETDCMFGVQNLNLKSKILLKV